MALDEKAAKCSGFLVPMAVPNSSFQPSAGNFSIPLTALKHNGQRWCALAVQDYESRALPLSYGGGPLT